MDICKHCGKTIWRTSHGWVDNHDGPKCEGMTSLHEPTGDTDD